MANSHTRRHRKRVVLTIGSNAEHYQQIFTGFSMLAKQGAIRLKSKWGGTGALAETNGQKIFYDVIDGYALNQSAINNCDIYYKRSYYAPYLTKVEGGHKVKPLGLNYLVYPDHIDWLASQRPFRFNTSLKRKMRGLLAPVRRAIQSSFTTSQLSAPAYEQKPGVLFLVRAWEPDESLGHGMPNREEVNEMRAECINLLRKRLGNSCITGFSPTPFAKRHYAHLLAPVSTERANYLDMVRDFATICIATTGLHGSIGWKLGEYVAFSKAIVSERLNYSVPGFSEGENYLEFADPDQCVDLVQSLMDDSEACMKMRQTNQHYYETYLRPDKLVGRTLEIDDEDHTRVTRI